MLRNAAVAVICSPGAGPQYNLAHGCDFFHLGPANMTNHKDENNLLGQFIPLHYHYQMLLDQARVNGFKQAIAALTPPGGLAADLGGGTGVLSFFAAKNAAKVWCVERNPQMVQAARNYILLNRVEDKVEVVEADARDFVPCQPVDVVICEMLHSALLREKQLEIISAFKSNYRQRFGASLQWPKFIPEATILAVQPVEQNFTFAGFKAPIPMFFEPTAAQTDTKELGDPAVYSTIEYHKDLPAEFNCTVKLSISTNGNFNALRFITKNVLAILLSQKSTIDWHNFYLVLPVKKARAVKAGDSLNLSFSYQPGGPLESLLESIEV